MMKKRLMGLFLLAMMPFSLADSIAQIKENHQICSRWSEDAEIMMSARQAGVTQQKMMEIALEHEQNKVTMTIIDMAYDKPRYETEIYKQKAIKDFQDEIYKHCMDALKK